MDFSPPAIEQRIAPSQDVILSVSGKPEEVLLFKKDVVSNGREWRVVEDRPDGLTRSLVIRARASVPYVTVTNAVSTSSYRLLTSHITYPGMGCATS